MHRLSFLSSTRISHHHHHHRIFNHYFIICDELFSSKIGLHTSCTYCLKSIGIKLRILRQLYYFKVESGSTSNKDVLTNSDIDEFCIHGHLPTNSEIRFRSTSAQQVSNSSPVKRSQTGSWVQSYIMLSVKRKIDKP